MEGIRDVQNTKCCAWNAEMMVKAYMTSYKLPCIITRGNNVYGPHQFPEKLVPKFTLLAKRGEQLPVHGGGQVCHSFHSLACACFYACMLLCMPTGINSSGDAADSIRTKNQQVAIVQHGMNIVRCPGVKCPWLENQYLAL